MEGFGVLGARPTTNHNPGDIIAGTFAHAHGALLTASFIAIFPDDATGWSALTALLKAPLYAHGTVDSAIHLWLGLKPGVATDAVGDNATTYIKNICEWCGCTPSTPIAGLLG